MEAILVPAIGLMNRFRYPTKFGIIFLIVLIPVVALSASLISATSEDVAFLEKERIGLAYIKTMRQPIEHIQQHRGMMAAYLNGTAEFRERIMQKRANVDKNLAELKTLDEKLGAQFGSGDAVDKLMRQWNAIKANVMSMTTAEAIKVHSTMIADMLALTSTIANASEITLDPKLDSYYMAEAIVSALPNMLENMGQARAVGSSVAAKGRFTNPKIYTKLAVLSNNIDLYFKNASSGLQAAYEENAVAAKDLKGPTNSNNNAIREMQALLNDKLLNAETITVSGDQVFNTATIAIGGSYKLYDALVPVLDQLFVQRIEAGRVDMIMATSVVVVVLALVAYLFTGFYFSVRQNIAQISNAASKLADGDLTVQVTLNSRDEMSQIGDAINTIAKGVGQTVSTVVGTNTRFVDVAGRLAESSRNTGNAVNSQVRDIEETAIAIAQMASAVQDVAANTAQAATAAQQANDAGTNGQQVVSDAVTSINKLADDLDHVAGVIHQLEENSQSISGILEVIRSIAEQTNLLALNAAIEAARAGEQGRGFAVVADEVRNLAGRTQESTLEIQTMIEQLQAGTREAVHVMEASSTQASKSVEHANDAGNVLRELTGLVASISDMNIRIAASAEEQSAMATEIDHNISNMSNAAEQSAIIAQTSVEDSAQAMALASESQSMLKRFQIDRAALKKFKAEHNHVLFQWDNSYSVNIQEIDRQHLVLIDLINDLYHEVKNNSDMHLLGRILQGLIDYTVSHFGYEEGLMERHDYEHLVTHRAKHKKLVGEVLDFQRRVNANDDSVVDELLVFLNDWLAKHIKGTDTKYAAVLNAKGIH
ncbi:MAG: bacteriohemerythrin [Gammaproteobacteria bacterium]|nr:bacteriohemerythrin [Gammaproteobacteria bacterium]